MDNEVIHYGSALSQSSSVYLAEKWLMNIDATLLQRFQWEIQSWLMIFLTTNCRSHVPVGASARCLQAALATRQLRPTITPPLQQTVPGTQTASLPRLGGSAPQGVRS